jgi:Zn-dependent metalloprotease
MKRNITGSTGGNTDPVVPKRPYLAAVNRLAQRIPDVRAVFDHFGHVRALTTSDASGLFIQPMLGSAVKQAVSFLAVDEISKALGLRHVDLNRGSDDVDPQLGHTVTFRQEVLASNGVRYPVRNGYVQVFIDNNGKVFNLNSSLRHGKRNIDLDGIITEAQAIEAAENYFGDREFEEAPSVELVFSAHNGRIDPCYEIVLCANNPRLVQKVLVKAHSGEVVLAENLLRSPRPLPEQMAGGKRKAPGGKTRNPRQRTPNTGSTAGSGSTPGQGKVFLRIPDPNKPIAKQLFDEVIDSLPDPKVLANDYFTMFAYGSKTPVKAKADGSWDYDPKTPEGIAVLCFHALNAQWQLMLKFGMKPSKHGAIPVFVEDKSVTDNAYFDPEAYEIHLGIGSGLNNGGLNRYIAYDLGVSWHESGHRVVYTQTPGNDLPGSEGGAMHESIGDVLGDLLMDWHFRSIYAAKLGETLDVAAVEADSRIIGKYALPPNGIRIAKNTKKTPQDKTGEVHDDGEISGGAKADLLVALIKQYGVNAGLELFGRTTLAALALMPANRCTFRDLLNSYVTADSTLNKGANKAAIVKAFGDHGITLGKGGRNRNVPTIIVID